MARQTKPLTNTEVKQAKPKGKEYNLVDGEGLKLRIKPNGSKQWLFNYYKPLTKQRANISFGVYPEVSLAEARNRRKAARELLAQDIDPKTHRDEQQKEAQAANELTLEKVINQWFEIKKDSVTPGYADDIYRSLNNHIIPRHGKLPLHQITAPAVIDALKTLANTG